VNRPDPAEQVAALSGVLSDAYRGWASHWKSTSKSEDREEKWVCAFRTSLAIAEATGWPPVTPADVADDASVQSAELDEIRCRRRLGDASFLARCDLILTAVGRDPNSFPRTNTEETADPPVTHFNTAIATLAGKIKEPLFDAVAPDRKEETARLTGLALSGGGIRSATFALGVLQGLASLDILRRLDYLSTVSGGGYAGSWLAAWIKRRSMDEVKEALTPETKSDPSVGPRAPIGFLRQYSNYLTPQLGIFSRDTWAMVSIYLRNMLLNLIILTAFLASVLLVPRCALWIQTNWGSFLGSSGGLAIAVIAGAWVVGVVLYHLAGFTCRPRLEHEEPEVRRKRFQRQSSFDFFIVLPLIFAGILTSGRIWHVRHELNVPIPPVDQLVMLWISSVLAAGCLLALALPLRHWLIGHGWGKELQFQVLTLGLAWFLHRELLQSPWRTVPRLVFISSSAAMAMWYLAWRGGFLECFLQARRTKHPLGWGAFAALLLAVLAAAAGFGAGLSIKGLALVFIQWESSPWLFTVLSVPLVLTSLCLLSFFYIGLLGANFPDERREWISRLLGRLLLAAIVWTLVFGCALEIPPLMDKLLSSSLLQKIPVKSILGAVWALITGLAVKTAHGRTTGDENSQSTSVPYGELIAKIGPYVFIAGMLAMVSLGIRSTLAAWEPSHFSSIESQMLGQFGDSLWNAHVWQFTFATILVMTILSFTVDVNEFSMHHFYRNRLVRCYLGASNKPGRNADGFTGFDPRDDVSLRLFAPTRTTPGVAPYLGPYPILNTAMNFTTGENLAYQERQAESFIFTPRYCGVDCEALNFSETGVKPAYRPTETYAYPAGGIHIGSAMAISGAAMSPNMGYHSSPATAFLLTIFNVRLGWWIGNPAQGVKTRAPWAGESWQRSSPWQGLAYLLQELAGSADDKSACVYLSDGGHFENLGIYELVRRKCRFIIVSDAEEDYMFGFEGLGNAIRKCRADFGVEIELDVDRIRPKDGLSAWHCVVGKVHYEYLDPSAKCGTIVYMKASLTGDEPSDILEYHQRQAQFPHQSTMDQFFDESQFESYRSLGYHIATNTFGTAHELSKKEAHDGLAGQGLDNLQREDLFNLLQTHWYPPCPAVATSFTKHADQLNRFSETLRTDPLLRFLHRDFFPEWKDLRKFGRATLPEMLSKATTRVFPPNRSELRLPRRAAELRSGFFFCTQLIQLMENVYLDLNLETYFDHPDNRGWANLFRHWTYSDMFRVTWAVTASTYGSRFGYFCWQRYDLRTGQMDFQAVDETRLTELERNRAADIRSNFPDALLRMLVLKTGPLEEEKKTSATPDESRHNFEFICGIVATEEDQIVYLRLRRHLRGIGLGRRAVRHLFLRKELKPQAPIVKKDALEGWDAQRFQKLVDSVNPGGV